MGKIIENLIIIALTKGNSHLGFLNAHQKQLKSYAIDSITGTFRAIHPRG